MVILNAEGGEVSVEVMSDTGLGNGEKPAFTGENTVSEGIVGMIVVGSGGGMKLCDFFREATAIVDKFPATGETLDTAERLEVHDIGLQHFVRWFGVERQPQRVGIA